MSDRPEAGEPVRRLALLVVAPVVVAVAVVAATLGLLAATGGQSHAGAAPLDLSTVPAQVAEHYHAAEQHPDTYRQVPCYCGCEEFLGHRHLYDCFVRADGAGWDAHAARCGICIAESQVVRELVDAGTDPAEITATVIERFGTTTITAPPT